MISTLFKRYLWVFHILAILVGSWITADMVNAVIGANIKVDGGAADGKKTGRRMSFTAKNVPLDVYEEAIRNRNIFDSSNQALEDEIEAQSGDGTAGIDGISGPVEDAESCTLPIAVVATVPVLNDPTRSLAAIQDQSESPPVLVVLSVGDEVTEDGRLIWVDREGIQIQRADGVKERCLIEKPEKGRAAVKMPRGGKGGKKDSDTNSVKKVSKNKYVLDKSEVQANLSNLGKLATEVRIYPYMENGVSKGFKIAAIKPGSLLSKIGLKNGDVLKQVNGYDMSSPEKALQAYSLLKTEKKIKVDVLRNGKPQTLEYDIR